MMLHYPPLSASDFLNIYIYFVKDNVSKIVQNDIKNTDLNDISNTNSIVLYIV